MALWVDLEWTKEGASTSWPLLKWSVKHHTLTWMCWGLFSGTSEKTPKGIFLLFAFLLSYLCNELMQSVTDAAIFWNKTPVFCCFGFCWFVCSLPASTEDLKLWQNLLYIQHQVFEYQSSFMCWTVLYSNLMDSLIIHINSVSCLCIRDPS